MPSLSRSRYQAPTAKAAGPTGALESRSRCFLAACACCIAQAGLVVATLPVTTFVVNAIARPCIPTLRARITPQVANVATTALAAYIFIAAGAFREAITSVGISHCRLGGQHYRDGRAKERHSSHSEETVAAELHTAQMLVLKRKHCRVSISRSQFHDLTLFWKSVFSEIVSNDLPLCEGGVSSSCGMNDWGSET